MKILHTSDWHLGQSFKSHLRDKEHNSFLEWLLKEIKENKIDILIVAGDIFDSANPPNYALKMYHDFLSEIMKTECRDIVMVAGNHDGVSTLEVSKDLLKSMNVHVVASGESRDEVLVRIQREDKLQAIICAVPYLRDRVLRDANGTKNYSEVEDELRDGIKNYYKDIYNKAKAISNDVPIIATGHFTTTGATITTESEREIYIGKLENVDSEMLSVFDYVAMGHIHKPQMISKNENMRYSGSPIPLSFSETNNQKSVVIVEFLDNKQSVCTLDIPLFKKLYRIKDIFENIKIEVEKISDKSNPPFLEIVVQDSEILNYDINEFVRESSSKGVEILTIQREKKVEDRVLEIDDNSITLSELDPADIFDKRLDIEKQEYSENMRIELKNLYAKIVRECEDEDN